MNPVFDQKTIETLRVASSQVTQADRSNGGNTTIKRNQNLDPKQAHNQFAEEFVQKLTSLEREQAMIEEEMVNVEKLWSSLVEKKKALENRRNELIKIKDRLKELDKEMSDVLKSQ